MGLSKAADQRASKGNALHDEGKRWNRKVLRLHPEHGVLPAEDETLRNTSAARFRHTTPEWSKTPPKVANDHVLL